MAELKRLGLDKNTVVVLWGDHGWHLGDYGVWGKHTSFDFALRSPLIMKVPKMNAPGVSTNSIAETVDIFPTLADICGLPVPDHIKSSGSSLKRLLNDPSTKIKEYSISARNFFGVQETTIRNEKYRLVINMDKNGDTTGVALFDHLEGSIPHKNLAAKYPDVVKKLTDQLKGY